MVCVCVLDTISVYGTCADRRSNRYPAASFFRPLVTAAVVVAQLFSFSLFAFGLVDDYIGISVLVSMMVCNMYIGIDECCIVATVIPFVCVGKVAISC